MPTSNPGTLTAGQPSAAILVEDTWPGALTIAKVPNADGSITPHPLWYTLDGSTPAPMQAGSHVCFDVLVIPNPQAAQGMTPTAAGERVAVRLVCEADVRYTVESGAQWTPPA